MVLHTHASALLHGILLTTWGLPRGQVIHEPTNEELEREVIHTVTVDEQEEKGTISQFVQDLREVLGILGVPYERMPGSHPCGEHLQDPWVGVKCVRSSIGKRSVFGIELHQNLLRRPCEVPDLTKLKVREIVLWGRDFILDLSNFKNMEMLQKLDLSDTECTGDIQELYELKQLQSIELANTKVTWNLSDSDWFGIHREPAFVNNLQKIEVQGTSVAGDWARTNIFPKLEYLGLGKTKVHGTIQGLCNPTWSKLSHVDLQNTSISGVFSKMHTGGYKGYKDCSFLAVQIKTLSLTYSKIKVDVKDLTNYQKLVELRLGSVLVSGDLKSLSGMYRLVTLHLVNTLVTGSVRQLQNISDLKDLSLKRCGHVDGDFKWLPSRLEQVDLRHTKVTGDGNLFNRVYKRMPDRESAICAGDRCATLWCNTIAPIAPIRVMKVTAKTFAPMLLCVCAFGFAGIPDERGYPCRKCTNDWYSYPEHFLKENRTRNRECRRCPPHSQTLVRNVYNYRVEDCQCNFGSLVPKQSVWNFEIYTEDNWFHNDKVCACSASSAAAAGANNTIECVPCDSLKLSCTNPGMNASTAPTWRGWTRAQAYSMEVFHCYGSGAVRRARCPGLSNTTCGPGYQGLLCQACADNARQSGESCVPCAESVDRRLLYLVFAGALAVLLIVVVAVHRALRRRGEENANWPQMFCSKLVENHSLLLQWLQMMNVVKSFSSVDMHSNSGSLVLYWREIMQLADVDPQLFSEALHVSCHFGYRQATVIANLFQPTFLPLVWTMSVLLGWCTRRWDIAVMVQLKAAPILYIGGLSATWSLSSCISTDSEGTDLPEDGFFWRMPFIQCNSQHGQRIFVLAWICLVFYLILIPVVLIWLVRIQYWYAHESSAETLAAQRRVHHTHIDVFVTTLDKEHSEELYEMGSMKLSTDIRGHAGVAAGVAGALSSMLGVPYTVVSVRTDGNYGLWMTFPGSYQVVDVDLALVRGVDLGRTMRLRTVMETASASNMLLKGTYRVFKVYKNTTCVMFEVCLRFASFAMVCLSNASASDTTLRLQVCVSVCLGMSGAAYFITPFADPDWNHLAITCFLCVAMSLVHYSIHTPWALLGCCYAGPIILLLKQAMRSQSDCKVAEGLREQFLRSPNELRKKSKYCLERKSHVPEQFRKAQSRFQGAFNKLRPTCRPPVVFNPTATIEMQQAPFSRRSSTVSTDCDDSFDRARGSLDLAPRRPAPDDQGQFVSSFVVSDQAHSRNESSFNA